MKRYEVRQEGVDVVEDKVVKRRYTDEWLTREISATQASIVKLQERHDELLDIQSRLHAK